MRILFITMAWPKDGEHNLYSDLMQEFTEHGHEVTVAAADEKKYKHRYCLTQRDNLRVLHVRTGNIQKTNKYGKVLFSFLAGFQVLTATHRYLKREHYDLILFSTPPITLTPSILLLKRRYHAKLYLLLKDIWPQDTVDIGGMRKGGVVWAVFRYLEKLTYRHSDYIGCMSPAGVEYIRQHNQYLKEKVIEVCPNSRRLRPSEYINSLSVRDQYALPYDSVVLLYGGNLGQAQGIEFLAEILREWKDDDRVYILIVGSGTRYRYLSEQMDRLKPTNAKLMQVLPVEDYERLVMACDVGLIFLHKDSSVPNFPSRLLDYLNAKLPVIAAVDPATDIGSVLEEAGCGVKVLNGDMESFRKAVETILASEETRRLMGENGYQLLREQYTADISYRTIISHFGENENVNQKNR